MAGGTGGHIFPGLAVAESLRNAAARVHWLGVPGNMESQWVPQRGFAFEPSWRFGGVRGKGLVGLAVASAFAAKLFGRACWWCTVSKPNVVVGLGGYITFPGGMMSVLLGKPLVLHEQNSVAGMANKVLARRSRQNLRGVSRCPQKGLWVGNPLRQDFLNKPSPAARLKVAAAL
jgi:UDP-N-acetylglucosamine--N-acetylmuramyl-(pentapeptide) pyrophosphoryl-undecaprenol N-acetylglucosamine transferase